MFNKKHVSADGPRGYTWAEWFEIVDLLGQIDYDCQFDCDGSCKTTRDDASYTERYDYPDLPHKGCCDSCASQKGYDPVMPPEAVAEVEAGYDDKLGWWRPGGCTLSPEYKSVICWTHHCGDNEDEEDPTWRALDNLIRGYFEWAGVNRTPPTLEAVRAKLAAKGMLRESTLVTIS